VTIQDPLKGLGQVLEPDERSQSFVGGLSAAHQELTEIRIDRSVPEDVQQLFETAKNVSLYSWFVYRFHQVAESVAFQALELGLSMRCEADRNFRTPKHRRSLRKYLAHALSARWIDIGDFTGLQQVATGRARMRKIVEAIADGVRTEPIRIQEPTEAEVEKALAELSSAKYIEQLMQAISNHRNELAHGSRMLAPRSRSVLRVVADLLNQLYPQ